MCYFSDTTYRTLRTVLCATYYVWVLRRFISSCFAHPRRDSRDVHHTKYVIHSWRTHHPSSRREDLSTGYEQYRYRTYCTMSHNHISIFPELLDRVRISISLLGKILCISVVSPEIPCCFSSSYHFFLLYPPLPWCWLVIGEFLLWQSCLFQHSCYINCGGLLGSGGYFSSVVHEILWVIAAIAGIESFNDLK